MAKHFKILFITGMLALGLFIFQFHSQADTAREPYPFVYLFHLYYDNGQLFADRDFEFKYDLIAEEYAPEAVSTTTPYKGEVISGKGKVEATFQFDPKQGNPAFSKGKISIKGPYFANASEVKFYNDQGKLLLTLDVGGSSFCNDDGVCNKDVGENHNNCPADCAPEPTVSPPPAGGGGLPKVMLTVLGSIVAAIVIWIIWVIIKRRRDAAVPPLIQ